MRKHLATAVLTLLCLSAKAQPASITLPPEFVESAIPAVHSDEWLALNHSSPGFTVSLQNGELVIGRYKAREDDTLKVNGGTLIGVDNGEWGGELLFQPDDTAAEPTQIVYGNINFIFRFNGKIYFTDGLAHLGLEWGMLYELLPRKRTGKFKIRKVLNLHSAPLAYTSYNNQLLAATHKSFLVVENEKVTSSFEDMFWNCLYPNSIAVFDHENVLVGIRGGIVKLNLSTKDVTFYKYQPTANAPCSES